MNYRWSIAPEQPLLVAELTARAAISPLLAQCLINRQLTAPDDIADFLNPRLKNLSDPFLLPNMRCAVDRLFLAHQRQERLVVFGDYDVDGVTSTTLLVEVLRRLGWQVDHYLPHRMEEGYGLSAEGADNCLAKFPVSLLLAVDCGSTAVGTIAALQQRGVDVIVLDHHQVSEPPPNAHALVNPQLAAEGTPSFRELCSVGLAFKLAHAVIKQGRETGLPGTQELDLRSYLDLVALGTIADLVPLTGENRILVTAGLQTLGQTKRPGLQALKTVAQVTEPVTSYEVGFQLGPRLNAAGRLENAAQALHLLLAKNLAEAEPLAQELDLRNRERQEIERHIFEQALGTVRSKFQAETDYVIVEGELLWHIGVVGIVASRIQREFHRPTIILGGEADAWRGSGRSIEGFDLAAALRDCTDFLIHHGGHAMAAGVTIHPDQVNAFRLRINELAKQRLTREQLLPVLKLDAETTLSDLTMDRMAELDRLKPTGQGNVPIQLMTRKVRQSRPAKRMGKEQQHVKLWLTDGRATLETVWWNAGKAELPPGSFDIAFAPQINEFNGKQTVQLKLLDWRPA